MKWSILIECNCKNMAEFDHLFVTKNGEEIVIGMDMIAGIMKIDGGEDVKQ